MAKPIIEKTSTKERIMIKMEKEVLQLLGLLTGAIISFLMGIWVSKKL